MTNTVLDYAIMAMDSYSRGDRPDIKGLPIVYNKVEVPVPTESIDVGFDASVYDVGGEIVISFRGTDFAGGGQLLDDMVHGWLFGAGVFSASQIKSAIDFYNSVVDLYPHANITLTGHSLGGGLAGFIGAIFGEKAVIFDNEPFEAAAQSLYLHADSTPPLGSENYEQVQQLRNLVYGGESPLPIDTSKISGVAIEGELLETIRIFQETPVDQLSLSDSVELGAVTRHSMSLLAIRQFAESASQVSHRNWVAVEKYIFESLFDSANSSALEIEATDQSDPNSVMMSKLAYSATQQGATISGNAALASWYDDGNDFGEAFAAEISTFGYNPQPATGDLQAALLRQLANTITQYSVALALNKIDDLSSYNLVSYDEELNLLAYNFTTDVLSAAGGIPNVENFDGDSFLAVLQDWLGVSIEPYLADWCGDEFGGNIDKFLFGTGFGGSWELQESDVLTAFFGTANSDSIVGSKQDDFIFTGAFGAVGAVSDVVLVGEGDDLVLAGDGDDLLFGGKGKDILLGGQGNDTLDGSSAINNLEDLALLEREVWEDRAFFDDNVSDRLEGGAGDDIYLIGINESVDAALEQTAQYDSYSGSFSGFFDVVIFEDYQNSQYFTKGIDIGSYTAIDVISDSSGDGQIFVDTSRWGYVPDLGSYAIVDVVDEFSNGTYERARGSQSIHLLNGSGGLAGNSDGFVYFEDGNLYGFSTYNNFGEKFHARYPTDEGALIGFHARFVIENFENGDFGIFLELPAQGSEQGDNEDFSNSGTPGEGVDYAGNGGNDIVLGSLQADFLSGGTGDDAISGEGGDDTISGDSGNDTLNGDAGDDFIDGGSGTDDINGGDGNDQLFGGAGDDTIVGGSGDDVLNGDAQIGSALAQAGNDLLIGGTGNDTYQFMVGSGHDTIREEGPANEEDGLVLLNLSTNDVSFQKAGTGGADLLITILASGETVLIENQFSTTVEGIEYVNFTGNDATGGRDYWDRAEIEAAADAFVSTNQSPVVANAIADQVGIEDASWSFTVPSDAFSDANGDTLTFSAVLADHSALPSWLSFDAGTRTFSGTPPQDFNGTLSLKVIASDGIASAEDIFDLVIDPVNDAPIVTNVVADQEASENSAWSFTVPVDAFSDVDGDTLDFSTTLADGSSLPAWLSFDAATRTFSGTPPQDFHGILSLRVVASDGETSVADVFDLVIAPESAGTWNTIEKVAGGDSWGTGHAASVQGFTGAGYIQSTAVQDNKSLDIGLSADGSQLDGTIDYYIWLKGDGTVEIRENNEYVTDAGTYVAGDVFVVERLEDGTVRYLKNGGLLYTSSAQSDPNVALHVDVSLFEEGTRVGETLISSGGSTPQLVNWQLTGNMAEVAPPVAPGSGNTIVKVSGGADWFNGIAASVEGFTGAGFVQSTIVDATKNVDIGVSVEGSHHDSSIDYYIWLSGGDEVRIRENGTFVATFGAYEDGDRFTIERLSDGTLQYLKNETVFYTSSASVDPAIKLFAHLSLFEEGSRIANTVMSSNGSDPALVSWQLSGTLAVVADAENSAPVVASEIADQAGTEGTAWSFTVPVDAFSDIDGDALSYSATLSDGSTLPAWLSFDAATRTFSGTPPQGTAGTLSLKVVAFDGVATAEDIFDLTVGSGQSIPVATWTGTDDVDQLWLSDADDVIDGRKGDDDINSARGSDTFLWRTGDGNDTFGVLADDGDTDELYLVDVQPEDVAIGIHPDWDSHITVTVSSTGEVITLTNQLGPENIGSRIDQVRFANGTIWDFATLEQKAHEVTGTGGDDTLAGTAASNTIFGLGGNDVISGGAGDDILVGGIGGDRLTGGSNFVNGDAHVFAAVPGGYSLPAQVAASASDIRFNTVEKRDTAAGAWNGYNAGVYSQESFTGAGSLSTIVAHTDRYAAIGLSADPAEVSGDSIDFAFYLAADGYLQIIEDGQHRATLDEYFVGDVLTLERLSDGTMQYLRNGTVVYTSGTTVPVETSLSADGSFYTNGSRFESTSLTAGAAAPVMVTWETTGPVVKLAEAGGIVSTLVDLDNDGVDDIVHVSQSGEIWTQLGYEGGGFSNANHVENISVYGSVSTNNAIEKIAGGEDWTNAVAASTTGFTGAGSMETMVAQVGATFSIGLSAEGSQSDASIDFAFLLPNDTQLQIWENGQFVTHVGTYVTGDTLSVERLADGTIQYLRNGAVAYTSDTSVDIATTLYALTAIRDEGGRVSDTVLISGGNSPQLVDWTESGNLADVILGGDLSFGFADRDGDGKTDLVVTDADGNIWSRTALEDSDVFVFNDASDSAGSGTDVIADFDLGHDRIDISALGLSYDDLSIYSYGGDTYIEVLNSPFNMKLENFTAKLEHGDFIF
ncbi:putative Ig domain-containing protein [Roseibium sp. M-1]